MEDVQGRVRIYIIDNKVYHEHAQAYWIFGGRAWVVFGSNREFRKNTHAIFFDRNNNVINIIGKDDCNDMWIDSADHRYIVMRSVANHKYRYNLVNRHCELVSDGWYANIRIEDKRFATVYNDEGKCNIMCLHSGELVSDEWQERIIMYESIVSYGFAVAYQDHNCHMGTLINLTDGSLVGRWYKDFNIDDSDPNNIMIWFSTDKSGKPYDDNLIMSFPEFLEFAENN